MVKAKRHRRTHRKHVLAGANTPPGFVRSSTGSIPGTAGPPLGAMTVAQFPILQFGDPGKHAAAMASRVPAAAYKANSVKSRTRRLKKYSRQPWSYKDKDMMRLVAAFDKSSLGEKKAVKASDLDTDLVKLLGALSVGSKTRKKKKGKSKMKKGRSSRKGSR